MIETAAAVLSTLSTGFDIFEKESAAKEKERIAKEQEQSELGALKARETEEKLNASQKTVERDQQVQSLVGHQLASEAASGFELGSASFTAITADDFDKFAQTRSNDALELSVNENQLQQDMLETKIETQAQITGDKSSLASGIFSDIGSLVGTLAMTKTISPFGTKDTTKVTDDALDKRKKNPGLFDRVN